MPHRFILGLATLLFLSACGGGGGSTSSLAVPPAQPANGAATTSPAPPPAEAPVEINKDVDQALELLGLSESTNTAITIEAQPEPESSDDPISLGGIELDFPDTGVRVSIADILITGLRLEGSGVAFDSMTLSTIALDTGTDGYRYRADSLTISEINPSFANYIAALLISGNADGHDFQPRCSTASICRACPRRLPERQSITNHASNWRWVRSPFLSRKRESCVSWH